MSLDAQLPSNLLVGGLSNQAAIEQIPLRRVGDCRDDVGRVVTFLASEDAKEGLAAFFQKREPQWTGR